MDKNQGMVVVKPLEYRGENLAVGTLFHVEHPDHALIFRTTGQARDAKPQELKAATRSGGGHKQTESTAEADGAKKEDEEGEQKGLLPGMGGVYHTRDMGIETGGAKVTRGR